MATAAAAGKNNHSCKIIILPMKRADLFERSGKVNKSSNKINSSHLGKLLSKLYKAKEELSNLLCNITKNEDTF